MHESEGQGGLDHRSGAFSLSSWIERQEGDEVVLTVSASLVYIMYNYLVNICMATASFLCRGLGYRVACMMREVAK